MSNASHTHGHHVEHSHGPTLADIVPGLELPATPPCAVDVGCGAGDDVRWLHAAGFQAVGIDASAEALQAAVARTPTDTKITWIEARATALPLPDQSCVLVTDRGCLHHLTPDEQRRYAAEAARVLVPDGVWIIRDRSGHHHQIAEMDADAIGALVLNTALRVESCTVEQRSGAHPWLTAVLRRN